MNNIEQNALRIAELKGFIIKDDTKELEYLIAKFNSYNGLMPIVFECNSDDYISFTMTSTCFHVSELNTIKPMRDRLNNYPFGKSEESFIEAIQECVIKYLEVKNEH